MRDSNDGSAERRAPRAKIICAPGRPRPEPKRAGEDRCVPTRLLPAGFAAVRGRFAGPTSPSCPPCGSGRGATGWAKPRSRAPGGELQGGRKVVSSAGRGEEAKGNGRKPHGRILRRDAKNPPMAAKPRAVPMEDPNNFGPDLPTPIIGMPHTRLWPGAPGHTGGTEGRGALSAALLPGGPRAGSCAAAAAAHRASPHAAGPQHMSPRPWPVDRPARIPAAYRITPVRRGSKTRKLPRFSSK